MARISQCMKSLDTLKARLKPGQTYRRADLASWSNAVDRHLKQLVADGTLTKLAGGLYHWPRKTAFGDAPPKDEDLVGTFLKDRRFLLASPNAYNRLGVGTTQLYDKTVVYNHKRHGTFTLGGRKFDFRVKPAFPTKLSREFLLVDLVNNIDQLAENRDEVLSRVEEQARQSNRSRLRRFARDYGNLGTRKFFDRAFAPTPAHATA